MPDLDAIVVGAGPNGLAAAITLARAGLSVHIIEADEKIGGGVRSAELTLPGFVHDICSALHPMAYASPFFRSLPLENHGLEWVHPEAALAHPFPDRPPVFFEHSIANTAQQLGKDGRRYVELFTPAAEAWKAILAVSSQTRGPSPQQMWAGNLFALAKHAPAMAKLGMGSLRSVEKFVERNFHTDRGRALIGGAAGHSMLSFEKTGTTPVAVALATAAHVGGWPFPRGGAQRLADALASYFRSLGGTVETGVRVRNLRQLPPARAVLLDLSPREILAVAGDKFSPRFSRLLRRYRYGLAAFKVDWALSAPVPWRFSEVARAATFHIGGSFEEVAASERSAWRGKPSERPFIIAAQLSLADPTRAPAGQHTLWAYCHVPNGCEVDMLERMERQIERFAPGFRETVLARSVMSPSAFEAHNPNLVGGDILAGMQDLWQILIRPTLLYYRTPLKNVYICSASTPPGAGVHGMCGYLAARAALRHSFRQ